MPRFVGSPGSVTPTPPATPSVTVDSVTTLVTGTISGKDHHARAATKRLNSGRMVLCWRDATAHNVNDGALHIKFSDDDGVTWSATDTKIGGGAVSGFPMNPSTLTAGQDAGEPWLYHWADNDLLVLHMWRVDYGVSFGGTWQSESTDGGETWTTSHGPIDFIGLSPTLDIGTFSTDDDFIDPVSGTLYAGGRVLNNPTTAQCSVVLVTTADHGVSWTRLSTIVSGTENGGYGAQEVGLELVGTSRIIAMIRDVHYADRSYRRFSDDMGVTWGTLSNVTTPVGIASRQRVYTGKHLRGEANWWLDPNLLMVGFILATPGDSQSRINCVWISQDAGVTWTTPFNVDTNTYGGDGGYGDVFYDVANDQYKFVCYRGSLTAADLVQYNLSITGI